MVEAARPNNEEPYDRDKVQFYLPLCPFERHQLLDLGIHLNNDDLSGISENLGDILQPREAFQAWVWYGKTRRILDEDLDEEGLVKNYQGDRNQAYEESLNYLAGMRQKELARVQYIRNANKDFLVKLGNKPVKDVTISAVDQDEDAWAVLSVIYRTFGRYWKYPGLFDNNDGDFDIWKLVRMFAISRHWPANKRKISELLFQHHLFMETFSIRTIAPSSAEVKTHLGPMEIYARPKDSAPQWPADKAQLDAEGLNTDDHLKFLIRRLAREPKLDDPRGYIHYIPWSELARVSLDDLRKSGIDEQIPFLKQDSNLEWLLWTPPYPGFTWNHHLVTEEEVYAYNILKDWSFPDHMIDQGVIFAARELGATDFIPSLLDYWEKWNDCALTRKSHNAPILLLETIPGLRFRSRRANHDEIAAITYFRNLVEAHAAGRLNDSNIKEILGPRGYSSLYEFSLQIIPEEQLSDINWATPLGRGANGAVYEAKWHRQPAHLSTMRIGDRSTDVVLKDVIPRGKKSTDTTSKFFEELDKTYASLGGEATSCIKFFGIATFNRVSEDAGKGKMSTEHDQKSKFEANCKIYLVFERATQGTLLKFLSGHLEGLEFIECWRRLVSSLQSIATGIDKLHQHGVLHRKAWILIGSRDLHLNNILVTDRYYPRDLEFPHEFDYLISDVGEGKVLRPDSEIIDPQSRRASYGALEFRAPEIQGGQGWSTKAEAFSFGVITCKLLNCRLDVSKNRPPEEVLSVLEKEFPRSEKVSEMEMIAKIVPATIKDAIEPCLSDSPTARPDMGAVVGALDNLRDDIESGKPFRVRWTYWDWNQSYLEGRRGTTSGIDRASTGSFNTYNIEELSLDS